MTQQGELKDGLRRTLYTNPVLDLDFPDSAVLLAPDGSYYAYATQTVTDRGATNIQVARSRDLVRWEYLGDALPEKPRWASETQDFWAPHVIERDGTYYMFYCANPDTREGLCLAVATARAPEGPFVDCGEPLCPGPGFVNIDPMPFDDPATGKLLLYWGSGFGPIKVRELAQDRLHFAPGSEAVDLIFPNPHYPYERLVEGIWVVLRGGYYYAFFSGDNCCGDDAHYAVMVARSRSTTGPFETLAEATGAPSSAILQLNELWLAPGHVSVITDAAGEDWLVYHAIDTRNRHVPGTDLTRRPMLIDRLTYRDGWPRMAGGDTPSTTQQPGPVVRA